MYVQSVYIVQEQQNTGFSNEASRYLWYLTQPCLIAYIIFLFLKFKGKKRHILK